MKVTSIELKTSAKGTQYKSIKFDGQIEGKSMVNVFSGSPHWNLELGSEVDNSLFSINQRGYLELSDRKVIPQAAKVGEVDVRIGFIQNHVKMANEKLDRIIRHLKIQTTEEKNEDIRNTPVEVMPFSDEEILEDRPF